MNIIGLIAAGLGLVGVVLGALGAHALRETLAASGKTEVWETAVYYNLTHAAALLALALHLRLSTGLPSQRLLSRAGFCWALGTLLFSGSLYVLALGGPRWLGPITPLGGLALIAGWLFAGLSFRGSGERA